MLNLEPPNKIRSIRRFVNCTIATLAGFSALAATHCSAQTITATTTVDPTTQGAMGYYSDANTPPATTTINGSKTGPILSKPWVYLIFWGDYWSAAKNPSPSPAFIKSEYSQIIYSTYLREMTQYGYVSAALSPTYSTIPGTVPVGFNSDTEVETLLTQGVLPGPPAGYQSLYVLIPPPSANYPGDGHKSVQIPSGSKAVHPANTTANYTAYAVIGLGGSTGVFSHELVEALSDPIPNVQDNWQVNFTVSNENEIGDMADGMWDIASGISVTCYWSQELHACVIPFDGVTGVAGNAITSYFDGNLPYVFYLSANNHIQEMYWTGSKWATTDLMTQPGTNGSAPAAFGLTALASYWDGNNGHVIYEGHDGILHELYHTGANGPWFVGGTGVAASGAALTAIYDPTANLQHVYGFLEGDSSAPGSYLDARPLEAVFNQGDAAINAPGLFNWGPGGSPGLSPLPTQPVRSQLASVYDGSSHLFYIDYNSHIQELVDQPQTIFIYVGNPPEPFPTDTISGWTSSTDWTVSAAATSFPAGGDALTCCEGGVFYVGQDKHIHELYRSGGVYFQTDVTQASADRGIPQVGVYGASALASYMDNSGNAHIFYLGADAHIHEEYQTITVDIFGIEKVWTSDDPTAITGSLNAIPSRQLTAVYDSAHGVGHVYFLLQDQRLNPTGDIGEVLENDQGAWVTDVPTSNASYGSNGPLAVP